MRKLMWFVIGFTAACAVAIYGYVGNALLLLCLPFFALTGLCFAFKNNSARILRMVFLGCGVAFLWVWLFHGVYLADLKELDGQTIECTVQATDYSEATDWGSRVDGKISLDGKTYRIRVYLSNPTSITPGTLIKGRMLLNTTFAEDASYQYHAGNGIYLVARLNGEILTTVPDQIPISCYPAVLRGGILGILQRAFPEDTLGFAKALLLGDRSGLDYTTLSSLSISGIRHVVAVSGLHVSILFSLVTLIFGYRRVATPVVGGLLLLLFVAVTGFTPSVVRAGIMHGLVLGAIAFQKEYDPPTALAFAVLAMLTVNPLVITSVGFQLSTGCLVGINLFSEPIRKFVLSEKCLGSPKPKTVSGKLKVWIAGSASMTLSTWIVTTPLCAAYFGTISLIGVLTNLLTLWLITLIFWGILIVCVLGTVMLPMAQFAAWLLSWPIRLVLHVARLFATFPLSAVYTNSVYVVAWLVFCYVIFTVFLLIKKKQPLVLALCIILSLVVSVAASWIEPRLDDYRFTMLNVGQGQCILIQSHGKHYLVDCGGDMDEAAADAATQTLLSQGVTQLNGVMVTHYDDDHAGAVSYVLSRVPAKQLYLPDIPDAGKNRASLETLGSDIIWISPENIFEIKESGITLYTTKLQNSDNENSMCVLFQTGNCDILITGDRGEKGERLLMAHTELPDLDVLVVGHHGAKGVASLPLLTQTMPETALISLGQDNPYGHPAEDVLERLTLFDVKILRTDQHGTMVIRG